MEEKSRVNMINATFAFIFINPCFLVRTCGIYHLCPISLLLSFYISFATYLPAGANLCKFIFLSRLSSPYHLSLSNFCNYF